MPLPVKLNDIIEALEEAAEECAHYLDRNTGEIVMITNEEMEAAEEGELISECTRSWKTFAWHSRDRHVGEDLRRLIKGSGAFRRFKDAIYSMGADKAWYEFRRAEIEKIAIQWLEEKEIDYKREDSTNADETVM